MGLDECCNYGPCIKDEFYDCSYKTRLSDYKVESQGHLRELVRIDPFAERRYEDKIRLKTKVSRFRLATMPLLPSKMDR